MPTEEEEQEAAEDIPDASGSRLVALYDFDPSTIDWPFQRQRPLPLLTGQVIQVIHDDGSDWALGQLVGEPEVKGYFPKNYTVSVAEYQEMMRDFESTAGWREEPGSAHEDAPLMSAIKQGPLPTADVVNVTSPAGKVGVEQEVDAPDRPTDLWHGKVLEHPPLKAKPTVSTAFERTQAAMLLQMPRVPAPAPEEPPSPTDDNDKAKQEVVKELAALEDPLAMPGGEITNSRASTPATYAVTRPERDFVYQPVPIELQAKLLKKVAPLAHLVRDAARAAWERAREEDSRPRYPADMRVRSTTSRVAYGIEPSHMRMALNRSSGNGAKWTQMFRPQFNDIVNESFKVGCNACILSRLYLRDRQAKEQFLTLHTKDVNGTMWFELQRTKTHLFYLRMESVDVMMCHPNAWGFPDTSRYVAASPGEPVNPFHGWFAQTSINADREMEDVHFLYTSRMRTFPEHVFHALLLGKVPAWVKPCLSLHAEAQAEEAGPEVEGDGEAVKPQSLLMEAGLADAEDLYVRLDELRLSKERTVGPDVLDTQTTPVLLKGLSAMRIFLRTRGKPDNMKQCPLTPKMVKDMAIQLGISGNAARYWYCLFALRYPLSSEWDVMVKRDTRWYLHLATDRLQLVHPMIKRFREHFDDCKQNEFLWDFRGFVKMKCSQCGISDSVLWCPQCTDYWCASCFLHSHKSMRGKKHWPMPIPGSRYLTAAESNQLASHVPSVNVGFSNRRRFLARDNQSDKNGARGGDPWLYFHAETFEVALAQVPEKHWILRRLNPPRLAPGAEGYYYNFAQEIIADDDSVFLAKTEDQRAISLLQKCLRGALARRRIRKESAAACVIQKCKLMWEVMMEHGSNGRGARLLKMWYLKHSARTEKERLIHLISRAQAAYRGHQTRQHLADLLRKTTRFQAVFRGGYIKRKCIAIAVATLCIQKTFRGHLGRRFMRRRHLGAMRIQSLMRGVARRKVSHRQLRAAVCLQAHWRGLRARLLVRRRDLAATRLQTNWRRFQAQLDVKIMLYARLQMLTEVRRQVLRVKLEEGAVGLIQRDWRRHKDIQRCAAIRRQKGDADKRSATMMVALFTATAACRHFVHPWVRHLPPEMRELLLKLKGPLQRAISSVPLSGKLANEELGRRGLRVAGAEHLEYRMNEREPDIASYMLLSVSRHLLSHVPAEVFGATVKWACYAIGHQAVALNAMKGHYPKDDIVLGKDMPPHPGDSLATLWKDLKPVRQHHDELMTMSSESMPCLILSGLPAHHRHVFLTAETLVTMRQAMDSPSISTEDHLKFQGLDASAGAQLMEVLAYEVEYRLPLDWPQKHGTVAALASRLSAHIVETPPGNAEPPPPTFASRENARQLRQPRLAKRLLMRQQRLEGQAQGQADSPEPSAIPQKPEKLVAEKASAEPEKAKRPKPKGKDDKNEPEEEEECHSLAVAHFNRAATLRVLQQVGFLIDGQPRLLDAVLGTTDDEGGITKGGGVRSSRFVLATHKLFDMADHARHDHCTFALAVILLHMVLRGLFLRVMIHRAAVTVQKWYRYFKLKSRSRNSVSATICIQRHWRGLQAALRLTLMDNAADKIQTSYRAWRWNSRAACILRATLKTQKLWRSAVHRRWLCQCHASATRIQRRFRGFVIRMSLDKVGREIVRRHAAEVAALLQRGDPLPESEFVARSATVAGRLRLALHKHRERNVDLRRMASYTVKSKHARHLEKQRRLQPKMRGSVQPARVSVFEPVIFAMQRLASRQPPLYGVTRSQVLLKVASARRALERTVPRPQTCSPQTCSPHPAARRGRAAIAARRLAKKPKAGAVLDGTIDEMCQLWKASFFSAG